tara:strand:+ start:1213 stop:1428 length:216 start_codon:yes stop_codon:yes gene_type:complete
MKSIFFIIILLSLFESNANAYLGLGPLIPLIGNAIVFIFFGFLAILGLFWLPAKKLLQYLKNKKKKNQSSK